MIKTPVTLLLDRIIWRLYQDAAGVYFTVQVSGPAAEWNERPYSVHRQHPETARGMMDAAAKMEAAKGSKRWNR